MPHADRLESPTPKHKWSNLRITLDVQYTKPLEFPDIEALIIGEFFNCNTAAVWPRPEQRMRHFSRPLQIAFEMTAMH